MKENDIGENSRAIDLHKLPVDVYARTTNGDDHLSGNINFSIVMIAVPGSIGVPGLCAAMKIRLY